MTRRRERCPNCKGELEPVSTRRLDKDYSTSLEGVHYCRKCDKFYKRVMKEYAVTYTDR